MFSKKATKIDKILTVDLTLSSKCQIYGEDFVNSSGLLRKYELYYLIWVVKKIRERSEFRIEISYIKACGELPNW